MLFNVALGPDSDNLLRIVSGPRNCPRSSKPEQRGKVDMRKLGIACFVCAFAIGAAGFVPSAVAGSVFDYPWSISVGGGVKDFEGDEVISDSFFASVSASYDYSAQWRFEVVGSYFPNMQGNSRRDWDTGVYINRLEEQSGVTKTSAMGLAVECMYHVNRWRIDPYLVVGGGLMLYADDVGEGTVDPTFNAGAGVMYHFNNEWAVRADARAFLAGSKAFEANSLLNFGVVWTVGAHIGPDYGVGGGVKDTDGDGLSDEEEGQVGTDIHRPDTDEDGLTDYEEVKQFDTDPLKPDTDMDMLSDGQEVHTHRTNPTEADTDKGGVADGHEVNEDGTNPLNPDDDLRLFTLNIEFDYNDTAIKAEYRAELDAIGKVLARNPNSAAKIEGHADKRRKSLDTYNQALSLRRAKAVRNYLITKWRVRAERLTAKGFGFTRPLEPNDPIRGSSRNRRVEVYVEGAGTAAAPSEGIVEKSPDDEIVK